MEAKDILKAIVYEWTSVERDVRKPEPDLVMAAVDQAEAYSKSTSVDGVMAPIYLVFAALVTEVVEPADTVLDLGCGAGNHLILAARLNPKARFVGMDLSDEMLRLAESNVRQAGLTNIEFIRGDMTDLSQFKGESIDAVISSMAFHHLPDTDALIRTHTEMNRVVKSGGGYVVMDFEHMKSPRTIDLFAGLYKETSPEIFVTDYFNSLKAAFTRREIHQAASKINDQVKVSHMPFVPFIYVLRSQARRYLPLAAVLTMNQFFSRLPHTQRADFKNLLFFLGLSKLRRVIAS